MLGTRYFRKIAIAGALSLCRCDESFVTEKDLMLQVVPRGRLSDSVGNETPVACDSFFLGGCERREQPVPLQPLGARRFARGCPKATPRPIASRARHGGADRVEHNVPRQLQQVRVLLNDDRFVTPLENMSAAVVDRVEALCVGAVELPHSLGQVAVRRLNEQVVV